MIMADSACIWTGAGFAPASRVVSRLPEDLTPWIRPVLSCLEPFAALLTCLGVSGFASPKAIPIRGLNGMLWHTGEQRVLTSRGLPDLMALGSKRGRCNAHHAARVCSMLT